MCHYPNRFVIVIVNNPIFHFVILSNSLGPSPPNVRICECVCVTVGMIRALSVNEKEPTLMIRHKSVGA